MDPGKTRTDENDLIHSKTDSDPFDILTRLVENNLVYIAEQVLLLLDEEGISYALAANPSWFTVIRNEEWINKFFANDDEQTSTSHLKAMFNRSKALPKRAENTIESRTNSHGFQ